MTARKRKMPPVRASEPESPKMGKNPSSAMPMKAILVFTLVAVIAGVGVHYVYFILPGRIATKSSLPKVDPSYDQKVWGAHRSHLYFGLRTQHPESPLFGMLWYPQKGRDLTLPDVRHWCEKDNGIKSYAFTQADGRTFGKQTIRDKVLRIQTDWINNGHSWTARVTTSSKITSSHALIFYFALQDSASTFITTYEDGNLASFGGSSPVSDNFTVSFTTSIGGNARSFASIREMPIPDASKVMDTIFKNTVVDQREQLRLVSSRELGVEGRPNLIVLQFNIPSNATVEISYEADGDTSFKGSDFDNALKERVTKFNNHFEKIYGLKAKGYSPLHQRMGRMALSNMLGSIGYHFGYNRVKSQRMTQEIPYGPHQLFTACPCRSTFPRGFIWDEGFHHLLFRKFDPELSLKIISSWLDTMNIDGWMPREMILGPEAEMRVPAEFIVQMDKTANPPMFFYLIQRFLDDEEFVQTHVETLKKMYPRLVLWHSWLNRTQGGPLPGTYRWRGRNETTDLELNPKTLASGFDDFPRATHPTNDEYHLDLRCWMAVSARVLARLASISDDSDNEALYNSDAVYLSDLDTLNKLHWSEKKQRFCDYGLHSSSVTLKDVPIRTKNGQVLRYQNGEIATEKKRVVGKEPRLCLVHNTFGYVSLFPVMLRLLPHNCPQLRAVLEHLRNEDELWTKFGLRSISKSSPYYKARNTKDDPPYWRGNIWINVNYMTISALKYYSEIIGPNQALASEIYTELRSNVVENLVREYNRTATLWEHYDDETGRGSGAYPFTGWSALVLSIMAEQYD